MGFRTQILISNWTTLGSTGNDHGLVTPWERSYRLLGIGRSRVRVRGVGSNGGPRAGLRGPAEHSRHLDGGGHGATIACRQAMGAGGRSKHNRLAIG